MEELFTNAGSQKAITALALTVAGFMAYQRLAFSKRLENRYRIISDGRHRVMSLFITRKSLGFIFLGLVPATLYFTLYGYPGYNPGMFQIPSVVKWLTIAITSLAIVVLVSFPARKQEFYGRIPEMRLGEWNLASVGILFAGWSVYLFAYEFLFRELLLFTWIEATGIIPAILINTVLYALVHIPKGMQEVKGSLVFGPLLCLGSLLTGSFLTAFIWHLALAVSSEMFAIYNNPGMQIKLNRK